MTPIFNAAELSFLRSTQEYAMQDSAVIQSYSIGSPDSYGQTTPVYTDGSEIAAGFNPKGGRDFQLTDDPYSKIVSDASIRLPIGTTLDPRDRIKITARYGETLADPLVFEIVGSPRIGSSGIVVDLRRIERE